MRAFLKSIELFFARFVPGPLRAPYFLAARYGTFVFGGLIGWLLVIVTEQALLRLGVWKGFGYGLGIVFAIAFTFTYHRFITFGLTAGWKERLASFAPLQIALSVANWALFVSATHFFGFPDVAASFVITFFLSLLNFSINRFFIFRK